MNESIKKNAIRIIKILTKIIGIIILVIIIAVFSILAYGRIVMNNLPLNAEKFYNKYEQELNAFVPLCFDNNIDIITNYDKQCMESYCLLIIDGYYIYSDTELSAETKSELEKIIKIIKRNHIHTVSVDDNQNYIALSMSRFLGGVSIEYYSEPVSIEEIKKDYYTDEAWYINENWAIISGD